MHQIAMFKNLIVCICQRTNSENLLITFISVTTPEVNKVKENLKRSCEELQNVVEDPLPNAKKAACKVIARKEKEMMQIKETIEKHCLVKEATPNKFLVFLVAL